MLPPSPLFRKAEAMSRPKPPKPAKLIIGAFMRDKTLIEPVARRLVEQYGQIDLISGWLSFDYTDYYTPEMGPGLVRRMMAFEKLIDQDTLADIKHFTNGIETQFRKGESRCINIDPGYLLHERFVLATGKNFTHRIYIGKEIYADLTLIYQKDAFRSLPWTYPDYSSPDMISFLEQARKKYIQDLRT